MNRKGALLAPAWMRTILAVAATRGWSGDQRACTGTGPAEGGREGRGPVLGLLRDGSGGAGLGNKTIGAVDMQNLQALLAVGGIMVLLYAAVSFAGAPMAARRYRRALARGGMRGEVVSADAASESLFVRLDDSDEVVRVFDSFASDENDLRGCERSQIGRTGVVFERVRGAARGPFDAGDQQREASADDPGRPRGRAGWGRVRAFDGCDERDLAFADEVAFPRCLVGPIALACIGAALIAAAWLIDLLR